MVEVKNGAINGKRVHHDNAPLLPNTLKGYWADENGNRIDKIAFGSVVRFYIDEWWRYNPKLKISIKSSDAEEPIAEGMIQNLNPQYFILREPYLEFTLKKRQEYTSLQKAGNLELYCNVPDGVTLFVPQVVDKIKVYEKVVIVIDPGHGHTKGTTGTCAQKYLHYTKDEKGNIKKDEKGSAITEISTFNTIPYYVYENAEACNKWNIQLASPDPRCSQWNEREIIFAVAMEMKPLLEKAGHEVYLTRTVAVKEGMDGQSDNFSRNKFSNSKNADYFISIHVNGNPSNSSVWKRGAFYMYRPEDNDDVANSKQLGISLVKYLKPYNKDKSDFIPIVTDANLQKGQLAVLSFDSKVGNKAKYKSLIEIGTYTNPKDALILFDNKDEMKIIVAEQVVKGLLEHINTNY